MRIVPIIVCGWNINGEIAALCFIGLKGFGLLSAPYPGSKGMKSYYLYIGEILSSLGPKTFCPLFCVISVPTFEYQVGIPNIVSPPIFQ